jgi:predicted transcriptional regulator
MREVVTIRLEPAVKKKLEHMAKATARTKSFLIAVIRKKWEARLANSMDRSRRRRS